MYPSDFSCLTMNFSQDILNLLWTQKESFKGHILVLLPGDFEKNTLFYPSISDVKLDVYHLSEISADLTMFAKESYEHFFLASTELKYLDQFILTLRPLFMLIKSGKGGCIRVSDPQKRRQIRQEAILQGWNVDDQNEEMVFTKPKIIQVAVPLPKKKSAPKKNRYNIKLDEPVALIDEDDLLDPSDLVFPVPKPDICGPQVVQKRKRCKNCSCGLAELQTDVTEKMNQMTIRLLDERELEEVNFKNSNIAISNCGNCYLGDAFRCSKCPYFGLPAFKPGEKVELKLSDLE